MQIETFENRLVEQINAAYSASQSNALTAKGLAAQAVQQAIRCGELLVEAKAKLKHGEWWEWLTAYCPEIHQNTAIRYMKLANSPEKVNLLDCKSITCAYIATGIIPEPEARLANPESHIKLHMPYISNLSDAYQAIARVRKEWDGIKSDKLTESVKNVLKSEKDVLVNLRNEITTLCEWLDTI